MKSAKVKPWVIALEACENERGKKLTEYIREDRLPGRVRIGNDTLHNAKRFATKADALNYLAALKERSYAMWELLVEGCNARPVQRTQRAAWREAQQR